jgi:predicted phosphatase
MQAIKNLLAIIQILATAKITCNIKETTIEYKALKIIINRQDVIISAKRDIQLKPGGCLFIDRKEINRDEIIMSARLESELVQYQSCDTSIQH